ncbi:MAG: PAS domain S-box protein [Bacteroidia bacterium]
MSLASNTNFKSLIKIIYIEDDTTDFIAFERMLKKANINFELKHVSEVRELHNNKLDQYDIIFIDHFLNGFNSFEILKDLKLRKICLPTVVVSSLYDKQFLEQTLANGAKYYLNKNNLLQAIDILKETFGQLPLIEIESKVKYFSSEMLELALDKEIGLLAVDTDGNIKEFNTICSTLLCKGKDEIGTSLFELFEELELVQIFFKDLKLNKDKMAGRFHVKSSHQFIKVKSIGYKAELNAYLFILEEIIEGDEIENLHDLLKEKINQNTNDTFLISDLQGKILLSNQGSRTTFGLKTDEIIGLTIFDLFKEEVEVISQMIQSIQPAEKIEFKARLSNSSRKKIVLNILVEYIQAGKGFLVYTIRDKSATELALEENEIKTNLINQVLQQTQICLFTLDEELNIKFLSEGIEKILGYNSYDLIGKNIEELNLISSEKLDINSVKNEIVANDGSEISFSIELKNKAGDLQKVYIQVRSFKKQNSNKVDLLGTIQSINQIEKIISSQAQSGSLNTLFENLKLIFYSVDRNFKLVVKSGYTSLQKSMIVHQPGDIMFSPFGNPTIDEEFKDIFELVLKGKTKEKIIQNNRHYYLFQFSPLEINGKIEGVVIVGIDRTHETKLTKDLEESKKNLETTINSFDELIWSINKEGQLISFNDAFAYHYRRNTRSNPYPGSVVESFKTPSREDERITELYLDALNGKSVMKTYDIWNEKIEFKVNPITNKNAAIIGVALLARNITKQDQLKKNYEVLSENIQDLVCIHDPKGNYIFLSPSIRGISGYEPQDLIGKNPIELAHPHDRKILINAYKSSLETLNTPSNFIFRSRTKNGEYRWLETNIKRIENPEKEYSFISSTRTIDERIANELEIKEKNKILTSISRGQEAFIQSSSTRSGFELILNQLIEFTESEFGFIGEVKHDANQNPYLVSHAITNIAWDEQSKNYYESNYESGIEFTNTDSLFGQVLKTGKVYISNDPKHDPNSSGTPKGHLEIKSFIGIPLTYGDTMVGMIGLANCENGYQKDALSVLEPLLITSSSILASYKNQQQKIITQAELEKSKADLLALLTSLEDLVLEVNENLLVENIWSSEENVLLMPIQEMKGKHLKEFVGKEELGTFISKTNQVLEFGVPDNIEYPVFVHQKQKWLNAKISLIKNNQKQKRISILIQDISERKESEIEIKRALEKEKQLNELKSRFVSMTSHEFKTPLSCIKSSAEIMELYLNNLNKNEEKFKKHLETINHEINRLTSLMNDVLVLGKIESDKMGCNKDSIDLISIANLVLERQQTNFKLNDKISLEISGEIRNVMADKMQIDHILDNLVSNAIKYSKDKQPPVVRIEFKPEEFHIDVQDYGIGIPEQEKPQLFQSFFRAKNVENMDGTGLGLVIIKNFVNLHGGEISYESKENIGTTFHIQIPG